MIISSIKIQNFGILADIEIDFGGELQHLAFVNGRNSRGKTSLLGSMKWCLLGEEPVWEEHVNKWALSRTKENDSIEVKVIMEVLLDHGEGLANIERSITLITKSKSVLKVSGGETLRVKVRGKNQSNFTDVVVSPEIWLASHFPKRLKNFFLFDGDLMQNFFDVNVQNYIADAVKEIAGVDKFEAIANNFDRVEEAANKKIASLGGQKTTDAEEAYRKAAKFENLLKDELSTAKSKLSELEGELDEVIQKRAGSEITAEQAKRAQELPGLVKAAQDQKQIAEVNFQKRVMEAGIHGLLSPLFGAVEAEYERAIKLGIDVPPRFEPKHIQSLLDEGACLCGCSLSDNSKARKALEALISQSKNASQIGNILSKVSEDLNAERIKAPLKLELIDKANEDIKKVESEIEDLRKEQEELSASGVGEGGTMQHLLALEQKRLQAEIYECTQEIGKIEIEISGAVGKTLKKKADFEKATKGLQGAEIYKKQSLVASQLAAASREIHAMAIESVRSQLEKSMSTKFAVLAGDAYQTKVTSDFEVLTLDASGAKTNLSNGLQMMKGYIFAIALREVINLGLPLVVDSPFGKLDQVFVEDVAQMLANLASTEFEGSSRQILFMMHDGEYTPYTRKHFINSNPFESYLAWEIDGIKSIAGLGIDPDWFKHTAWKDWKEGKIQ